MKRFAPTALMLGNIVTGCSVLAPAGMLAELSSGLGVTIHAAGLLITFGAIVLCCIPANLIAGHPYAFTAAMNGEFGPLWSTIVWGYMFGIYIFGLGPWTVTLGAIAIQRVQRIPGWAAALIMLFSYILWFYGIEGSFVR